MWILCKNSSFENVYNIWADCKAHQDKHNISEMQFFCMYIQKNTEDWFHKDYKLATQDFLIQTFSGPLYVKVKNIASFTKVLQPCNIIGFLFLQSFIMSTEKQFQSSM